MERSKEMVINNKYISVGSEVTITGEVVEIRETSNNITVKVRVLTHETNNTAWDIIELSIERVELK
jgi:acyl-CoA hydrolase